MCEGTTLTQTPALKVLNVIQNRAEWTFFIALISVLTFSFPSVGFSQICQVEMFQFTRKVKAKKNLSLSNYLEKLEKSHSFVASTSFVPCTSIPMSLSLKSLSMQSQNTQYSAFPFIIERF